jgi:hypothetical protein
MIRNGHISVQETCKWLLHRFYFYDRFNEAAAAQIKLIWLCRCGKLQFSGIIHDPGLVLLSVLAFRLIFRVENKKKRRDAIECY